MGLGPPPQTIGFKYRMDLHLVLSIGPIDKITRIEFDEKTAWEGNGVQGEITINAENLFGGEDREGGVSGKIDILLGAVTQLTNPYLISKLGPLIPAFRGVVSLVFKDFYVGMNPFLKNPRIRAQRILTKTDNTAQWNIAKAQIGNDMNPAHIIRECLTDNQWGLGYNELDIDDVAFAQCADTLFNEGMGISILWSDSTSLEEFIKEILKHIDGSLYQDRTTGKLVLKLVRNDYTIASLPVFNENNIVSLTNFKRANISELINSVTVVYWDPFISKNNSVTVQDIATINLQGAIINTTIQYPGFTNPTIATRAAERELRALSSQIATCTLTLNRTGANLNIGDPFILNWPRYGISNLIMRVANVEVAPLSTDTIKIQCVQDVFNLGAAIYNPPPPSEWVDPINDPQPLTNICMIEAPYWELIQQAGQSVIADLDNNSGYAMITGSSPTPDAINARIFTNPTNTSYSESGIVDFCPFAQNTNSISLVQNTITIQNGIDLELVTSDTYAIINNEIMKVISLVGTTLTVGRGTLDTIPQVHPAFSKIFFADNFLQSDQIEYLTTDTVRYKLLTTTGKGTLAVGSAPETTIVIQGRQARPYPPGRFRINSQQYPLAVRGDIDITISWAHRDRLQQTVSLLDTNEGSIGPESGTTYTASILLADGTVVVSQSGIAGTSRTFTLTELGLNYGNLRVQLFSVRSGLESFQKYDYQFDRVGFGTSFGNYFGGI